MAEEHRVYPVHVCVCVCMCFRLCVPESCLTNNFIMHGGIWKLFGTNDHQDKTRQCVACKNHVARSKVKVTAGTLSLCISKWCPTDNFIWKLVGFENRLPEMIIMTRRCVGCKNHIPRSKVKVTVHTYSLCIGILCSAQFVHRHHNFIWHGGIGKLYGTNDHQDKTRQCVMCKNHVPM